MDTNRVRSANPTKLKIFTEEEWSRINDHFRALENLKKKEEESEAKFNSSGNIKTQVLLAGRPHWISKRRGTVTEDLEKVETLPKMEPMGKALTSEKKREEIIKRAKKLLFENKDYARQLLHGLRLSSVLHERNKQVDFSRNLRNMMIVMEREIKMELREEADRYKEEVVVGKIKKKERDEKLRKELEKQIRQKVEGRQLQELEKAREGEDIIKMNEEHKTILQKEREEEMKRKEKLKKDIENYTKSEREIRAKLKIKEEEQEEVNKIYQTVAWDLDKRRRDKEKARFRKTIKVDKVIFKGMKEPLEMRSDGDKKLKNFLVMREAPKKALLNDLLAGRKMAEEEMKKRRTEEKLERKKCAVERCRREEADRLRNLREEEERRKLMNNTRKYYIMQWMEKKELQKEEKELDKFYAPDFTEENKMIAEYCDEVLALVKRNRRPVFPVAAAVKNVKKEFGLEPVRNLNFLKSNVPIGK